MQREKGRTGLAADEQAKLALLYDSLVSDTADDAETVRLLTRPLSVSEVIPEYYRYSCLHVYDWFLDFYPDDPVGASLIAMRATLVDLIDQERMEAKRHEEPVEYIVERMDRLDRLIDQVDTMSVDPVGAIRVADLVRRAEADEVLAQRLFTLVKCTNFPRSDDHNEHVFLRAVHACELVFYLVRWMAYRTAAAVEEGEPDVVPRLAQLAEYAGLVNSIFHVLSTLSPDQFINFREATGAASAVQSLNFHLMEISVYGYDPRKTEVFERFEHLGPLSHPPFRDARSLRDVVVAAADDDVTAAFVKVERALLTWRGRHYGFGRRYLPPDTKGSGGSEGAGYLKRFIHKDVCLSGTSTMVDVRLMAFASC